MNKPFQFILILLFSSQVYTPAFTQQQDTEEIMACFYGYKQALIQKDGEKVLNWVAQSCVTYYDNLALLAKYAGELELKKQPVVDQVTVLTFRHTLEPKVLEILTGGAMLSSIVSVGKFSSEEELNKQEISPPIITDSTARAQLVADGAPMSFFFHFLKENGTWKLDLLRIIQSPESDAFIMETLEKSGLSEEEFIISAIFKNTGVVVDEESIWKVPVNR